MINDDILSYPVFGEVINDQLFFYNENKKGKKTVLKIHSKYYK
jgi:hypothetical protein